MANQAHSTLTDPHIHEPKGAAAAASGKVYRADGLGSGAWYYSEAYGLTYFVNIATPYSLTYPSTYTKLAPTTTAGGSPREVTEATTARITYTGTPTRLCSVFVNISISQSVGAARDLRIKLYKNGVAVAHTEVVITATSGEKHNINMHGLVSLATNDYLEVYAQNDGASGDVNIHTYVLQLTGH